MQSTDYEEHRWCLERFDSDHMTNEYVLRSEIWKTCKFAEKSEKSFSVVTC